MVNTILFSVISSYSFVVIATFGGFWFMSNAGFNIFLSLVFAGMCGFAISFLSLSYFYEIKLKKKYVN